MPVATKLFALEGKILLKRNREQLKKGRRQKVQLQGDSDPQ
jgi:hypothetical protein